MWKQDDEVKSFDTISRDYVTSPKLEQQKRDLKRFVEQALVKRHCLLSEGVTVVRIDYEPLLEDEEEPHDGAEKEFSITGPCHSMQGGAIKKTKITLARG